RHLAQLTRRVAPHHRAIIDGHESTPLEPAGLAKDEILRAPDANEGEEGNEEREGEAEDHRGSASISGPQDVGGTRGASYPLVSGRRCGLGERTASQSPVSGGCAALERSLRDPGLPSFNAVNTSPGSPPGI